MLYDLTNTYFEGQVLATPKAKRGHSKEKRRAEELDGAYSLKTSRTDLGTEEIWRTYLRNSG